MHQFECLVTSSKILKVQFVGSVAFWRRYIYIYTFLWCAVKLLHSLAFCFQSFCYQQLGERLCNVNVEYTELKETKNKVRRKKRRRRKNMKFVKNYSIDPLPTPHTHNSFPLSLSLSICQPLSVSWQQMANRTKLIIIRCFCFVILQSMQTLSLSGAKGGCFRSWRNGWVL